MISDFIKKLPASLDFSLYESVFVGFSGGADSTAALLILKELQKTYSFRLIAVHFEHGIRGKESLDDAMWCRSFCERFDIEYREFSLNTLAVKHHDEGIEEAARRLRMNTWNTLLNGKNSCIVLGHHSGDKIENLLIRLLRGSNSSGLTSLRYVSEINGVIFIRPLLDFTKSQLGNLLSSLGINDWRIDSTNHETLQRRNFIRNEVLPLLEKHVPNVLASLNSAYSAIQCDAQFIEECASEEFSKLPGNKALSISYISSLHVAVRIRVMRHWLTSKLGFEYIPSKDFAERFNSEIQKDHQEKSLIPIDGESFVLLHKDNIFFTKKEPYLVSNLNTLWKWRDNSIVNVDGLTLKANIDKAGCFDPCSVDKNSICFDAELIPSELIIRYRQEGDRFTPFGYDKEVKVSKIMQNEKVSNRNGAFLLTDAKGKIYWIIGIKRSDSGRVTSETKQIVCFSMENKFD